MRRRIVSLNPVAPLPRLARSLVLGGLFLAVVTMTVPAAQGLALETTQPQHPASASLTDALSWHDGAALQPGAIPLCTPVERSRQPEGFSSVTLGARRARQGGPLVPLVAFRQVGCALAPALYDLHHAYLL